MSTALPITRIQPSAYYPFFTGSLLDHSNNTNDGTVSGTPRWGRENGVIGILPSGTGRIVIPHNSTIDVGAGESYTIFGRCYAPEPGYASLWIKRTGAGANLIFWRTSSGVFQLHNGVTSSASPTNVQNARTWCMTHVNSAAPRFYADGVRVADGASAITVTTAAVDLSLGAYYSNVYDLLHALPLVVLWKGVLTESEVATMHEWAMDIVSPEPVRDRRYFQSPRFTPGNPNDVLALDFGKSFSGSTPNSGGGATGVHTASANGDAAVTDDVGGSGVKLDGASGYVSVADHADLSFGDGSNDSAFSVECALRVGSITNLPILSKGVYNTSAEYRLLLDGSGVLHAQCFDESVADCYIGRKTPALTLAEKSVVHVLWTYDGSKASAGHTIYVNGAAMDNADSELNAGSYVAMEALAADLHIGRDDSTYGDGTPLFFRLISKELTAGEAASLAGQWNRRLNYYDDFAWTPTSLAAMTPAFIPDTDLECYNGSYKIGEDDDGKYLEWTASGTCVVPNKAGVGTWEIQFKRGASSLYWMPIASNRINYNGGTSKGYAFYAIASGTFYSRRMTNGSTSGGFNGPASYFASNTLYTWRVTRTALGVISIYTKGGVDTDWKLIPATSLTNPYTDIVHGPKNYQLFNFTTGAKLYSIKQYNGVVSPV